MVKQKNKNLATKFDFDKDNKCCGSVSINNGIIFIMLTVLG